MVCIMTHCICNVLHTGVVTASPSNKQLLDQLPVERERGITVKAQTASMYYREMGRASNQTHLLNLIDTPVSI